MSRSSHDTRDGERDVRVTKRGVHYPCGSKAIKVRAARMTFNLQRDVSHLTPIPSDPQHHLTRTVVSRETTVCLSVVSGAQKMLPCHEEQISRAAPPLVRGWHKALIRLIYARCNFTGGLIEVSHSCLCTL